ncbi:MAG: oxidoreductase [Alcaligenaceae bacterium]|jgi:2-hydroxy-4-carboxymuconate semialdehyde hemiacetal dehydrogenase|nr:oxidoreductase [Alcaligenaceae bacterium]
MKVGIAGIGAFGLKHLEAIGHISGVEVICITGGRDTARLEAIARRFKVPAVLPSLEACLALPEIDAMILCGPTQVHTAQALACLQAGKHVQVEIPMADNLAGAQALAAKQQETGLVAMAGHTRRYNPSHQWIHHRIQRGELALQQLDVQTYFFRRSNVNAEGQPRSWTDHLLWHHACHTVDLFQYQTGEVAQEVHGMHGPLHPALGIAMDMSVQLKVASGALCTLSLSFNNQGPQGSFFRYICDNGTYIARYDELVDGEGKVIDVSGVDVSLNGIELQDREFFAAIREHREPRSSIARVLPAYETLDRIEKTLK